MSYYHFLNRIDKEEVKVLFELGSCTLEDGILLSDYFKGKVYSFECNPDCLVECEKNLLKLSAEQKERIFLIKKAVSLTNGDISFFPFDLEKYNNMGASSLLKIDFSKRNPSDPDYNRENVQREIVVSGTRLDTFIEENNIEKVDMLCIDLQGYELNAIKSLGDYLHKVKYIITETSIASSYENGSNFFELNEYLKKFNFRFVCTNRTDSGFPKADTHGFSEFDALFVNYSAFSEE